MIGEKISTRDLRPSRAMGIWNDDNDRLWKYLDEIFQPPMSLFHTPSINMCRSAYFGQIGSEIVPSVYVTLLRNIKIVLTSILNTNGLYIPVE